MEGSRRRNKYTGIPLFASASVVTMLVWLVLLSIALSLTLRFSMETLQQEIDSNLTSITSSVASLEPIRDALTTGRCEQPLSDYLDHVTRVTPDMDLISIANRQSIRVYHTYKDRIGKRFVGGDEDRALAGEAYLSDATGTMGYQHRSFSPVFDEEGQVLGFVMASTTRARLDELRNQILLSYGKLLLILSLLTLCFFWLLAIYLRQKFQNARPEDLIRAYLTQNEILNSLDEGLMSLDGSGQICFVNQAAQEAMGLPPESLLGEHVDNLLLHGQGGSLRSIQGDDLPTSRPSLLVSSINLPGSKRRVSQVLILKDKSETIRRAEQLNSTRHIISALRANTHEYTNKLQVISGLLQMNRVAEALAFISDSEKTNMQLILPIMKSIHNTNVAALLLGKLNNMREMDIHMTLLPNSHLPENSSYLSTKELVTVIGNLLENAIEAVDLSSDRDNRNTVLQITEDDSGLLISVSDTGIGIPPEALPHIWEQGFSSKADKGRGVGMSLIKNILERRGGCSEVDSEPGGGTSITLIFNQKREAKP